MVIIIRYRVSYVTPVRVCMFHKMDQSAGQFSVVGGRRGAPESVVCSAIAVGSVVFHNHNAIAATPHPSPVLCDTFSHRLPALVSWDSPLR